jgi:predicted  nucleic acid-binding Zn-ribbon protein
VQNAIPLVLKLQKEDTHTFEFSLQLKRFPLDIQRIQDQIDVKKQALEDARKHIYQLDAERKAIESDLKDTEAKLVQYKTQQIGVKKQETYVLIQKNIGACTQTLIDLESKGLDLLLEIDKSQQLLLKLEATFQIESQQLKSEIDVIKNQELKAQQQQAHHIAVAQELANQVPKEALKLYNQVKSQRAKPPFVVALKNQICAGCNLKVDNAIADQALKKLQWTSCSQCGRILIPEGF